MRRARKSCRRLTFSIGINHRAGLAADARGTQPVDKRAFEFHTQGDEPGRTICRLLSPDAAHAVGWLRTSNEPAF